MKGVVGGKIAGGVVVYVCPAAAIRVDGAIAGMVAGCTHSICFDALCVFPSSVFVPAWSTIVGCTWVVFVSFAQQSHILRVYTPNRALCAVFKLVAAWNISVTVACMVHRQHMTIAFEC